MQTAWINIGLIKNGVYTINFITNNFGEEWHARINRAMIKTYATID